MARWKLLLSLAVLTPLFAYVAGTLASGSDGPAQPTPVILEQSVEGGDDEGSSRSTRTPAATRPSTPSDAESGDEGAGSGRTGDNDDGDDDEGDGRDDEPDGPVVVTPRPTELQDDETAGGDDDRDDDGDDTGEDTESDAG